MMIIITLASLVREPDTKNPAPRSQTSCFTRKQLLHEMKAFILTIFLGVSLVQADYLAAACSPRGGNWPLIVGEVSQSP